MTFDKESRRSISNSIVRISVIGIALSLAVMIIATAVVTGFKHEIRRKIIGFGSHIQIVNYDANSSYETEPINRNQAFVPLLNEIKDIRHIQAFITKPGIIKVKNNIQGAIVKGVGSDFDWSFFKENLVDGKIFEVNDSVKTNQIVISRYLSDLLKLKPGDRFAMYFISDQPRGRVFTVSGVYQTSLMEFDKQFILADMGHLQELNGWKKDHISGFEILLDDYDVLNQVSEQVFVLAGLSFNADGSKMQVINIRDKYPQIFDWLGLIDKNVWVILTLMLIVSAFNMTSGLLIIILDRISMIGTLKALGMNDKGVRSIFLYQSVYIMLKGLFWGNLVGTGICLAQYHFRWMTLNPESYFLEYVPVNLDILHLMFLNLGTFFVTLSVLILPAHIIARIDPAHTIRYD